MSLRPKGPQPRLIRLCIGPHPWTRTLNSIWLALFTVIKFGIYPCSAIQDMRAKLPGAKLARQRKWLDSPLSVEPELSYKKEMR